MGKHNLYPIIFNSSNLIQGSSFNNRFRYSFPRGSFDFKNSKVALSNVSVYYSWFNITASQNNNTYELIHPTSTTPTTLTITMPDGFYDVSALNSYLQQVLISNGLYLVNSSGDFVYYAEFIENPTFYSIQFNSYELPTALPAGWSNPGGFTFPAGSERPQLTVLSNNFTNIIGFDAGTYPASGSGGDFSQLSTFTPQITPIQSIVMTCSLLDNKFSNPNTILYSFGLTSSYGSLIVEKPVELSFININEGAYNDFEIEFRDQDFNEITLKDTNIIVQLLIMTDEPV